MSNTTIRARAQSLVRRHWGTMICMFLLIGVACFAASFVIGLITGVLSSFSVELAMVISALCSIAVGIVSSGLSLGYAAALIRMNEDKPVRATDVFNMIGHCLPAFGLNLWLGLKIFLWMLPGLAVAMLGVLIGALAESEALMTVLFIIGYVLIFVFVIRAAYSYAMSTCIFADKPSVGVFGAVNESKSMMHGRRLELFLLTLPYALIMLAVSFGYSLLAMLFAAMSEALTVVFSIVGGIAIMVVSVYISLLTSMASASFYKAHTRLAAPVADTDDFPMESPITFDF